jgi:hypothetical protein
MVTLTESIPGPGGFLASEANGMRSREKVTIAAGQNLKSGTLVTLAGGKYSATAAAGTTHGILFGSVNATAADKPGVIIARDAEVVDAELGYPAGSGAPEKATFNGQLATIGIIVRAAVVTPAAIAQMDEPAEQPPEEPATP